MAKDAVATMGGILPDDAGGRDAVHVAVFSAISDERTYPGQAVTIVAHGETDTKVTHYISDTNSVGIADPFIINSCIEPGQRFWVYLKPRTITALSHKWSHPAFENVTTSYVPPATKLSSEDWLKNFCSTHDCPGYDTVMELIEKGEIPYTDYYGATIDDEYMHFSGSEAYGEIPAEFWVHVKNVIGREPKYKPEYFSCSC